MPTNDFIRGSMEDDELTGADGADTLHGGYGDDRLDGGEGNDVLDGGRGSDLLIGGAGNDSLIAAADAGEPVIAQTINAGDDPDGAVDPTTGKLYPGQPFVADDVLIGGAGADSFIIKPLINAKQDIIEKHTNAETGVIDWSMNGIAGENNEVHDHWVESVGTDVITDYDKADGDQIYVYGHTTTAAVTYADVDGDGDEESIITLQSNQANGGAHDNDILGRVIVHGDRVEQSDLNVKAGVEYGIVENIADLDEALNPTGVVDPTPDSTVSDNPFLSELDLDALNAARGPQFQEYLRLRDLEAASDDVITGTDGDDMLVGDPQEMSAADLGRPLSYWAFEAGDNGVVADERGTSDAGFYKFSNDEAQLQADGVPMTDGPDGGSAALFDGRSTFAYAANDASYQVLNGTVTAWFRPDDLGGTQTILAKDELNADEGGHFHIRIDGEGRLAVRLAEGEAGGSNHTWQTRAPVVSEGQWQHVAVSFGAAGATVYLNGQAIADDAFQKVEGGGEANMSAYTGAYALGNDKPFVIGASTRTAADTDTVEELSLNQDLVQFFDGGIADVGFWGGNTPADALNSTQVAELFSNGTGDLSGPPAMAAAIPVGNDTIDGAGGNDDIDGGAGDDQLSGGDGNDTIMGGYGNDTVAGGAGADVLDGGHGNDSLDGGDGDDIIISRSDAREPVIAQNYGDGDDPDGEIDPATDMLYPSQANLPADDILTGGAGADEFRIETLINAKEDIINRHVNNDRTIDWSMNGVAGENNNVHDHWVDGIGNDIITDFNAAEGDTLSIKGHTTEVYRIEAADVDGDGAVDDTILHLRSNQGANGGAHNLDLLGTVSVLNNILTANDFETDAGVHYGIVETIDEIDEAITPLGVGAAPEAPAPEPEPEPDPDNPDTGSGPDDPGMGPLPDPQPGPEDPVPGPEPTEPGGMLADLLRPPADATPVDAPTSGDDVIIYGDGDDTGGGRLGNDLLIGGGGADEMSGSWGDDRLDGGAGDDHMHGNHGDDLLAGGDGDDFLTGNFGDDILVGGAGEDELRGNRGEDVLFGGAGDDVLHGGAGDDILHAGSGEDLVNGGSGRDAMLLNGRAADYAITVDGDRVLFEDSDGSTDIAEKVELFRFVGSGETYTVENGTFVATADTDDLDDLLDDALITDLVANENGGNAMTMAADDLMELDTTAPTDDPAEASTVAPPPIETVVENDPSGMSSMLDQDEMRIA